MACEPEIFFVYITTSNKEEASTIGKALVEEHLAACANIVPEMSSVFYWEGKLEEASESILLVKTGKTKLEKLIARVKELHSYDVPAIVAMPIKEGNPDFVKWVKDETE